MKRWEKKDAVVVNKILHANNHYNANFSEDSDFHTKVCAMSVVKFLHGHGMADV